MKKLSLIALLFILSCSVFAADAWVDNKAVCEKTKGNWQIFNNDCADTCDNKFDISACSSILIYSCNCGSNRCWDGYKCISQKVAKLNWLDKTKDVREKRRAELEEIKLKTTLKSQEGKSNPQPNQNLTNNQNITSTATPNQTTIPPTTPLATPLATPPTAPIENPTNAIPLINVVQAPVLDPATEQKNAEQKAICEKQSGIWKDFKNGCADNCGSKISKMAMCTMSITLGCECGGSKCWDSKKNVCTEIEEYKASFMSSKPSEANPSGSLPAAIPSLDPKSTTQPLALPNGQPLTK